MSLKVSFSYGVPLGPESVAVHLVMSAPDGKAEMPGVGEVIRAMSSDCNLYNRVSCMLAAT